MAADGGLGSYDDNFAIPGGGGCGLRSGIDDSDHRNVRCGADSVERQGGGGVAGDDQHLCALGLEKVGRLDCVTRNGLD